MVTATPQPDFAASGHEWLDVLELQARRVADDLGHRLAFSIVPRTSNGCTHRALLIKSDGTTLASSTQDWQGAIEGGVKRPSSEYTCLNIEIFSAGMLEPALIIYREPEAALSPQSSLPAQPVANSSQHAQSSSASYKCPLASTTRRPPPQETATYQHKDELERVWTLTDSVFITRHQSKVIITDGDVTKIPRRIQIVVEEYENETRKLEEWLLQHLATISPNSRYPNGLDSVEKLYKITKYTMQPSHNKHVLAKLQPLREKIAELEQIIFQRQVVSRWYKEVATHYGLQDPDTAVSRKTADHEYFVGVLKKVHAALTAGARPL